MSKSLGTFVKNYLALSLFTVLTSFGSGHVLAQTAPARINWGNTETQTSPAPAGAFKQAAPQQTAPLQATQPAQNAAGAKQVQVPNTRAKKSVKKLSELDDKAIIIVGGKQTTVGALKQSIKAELAKKTGEVKTVKAGARKPDISGYHVVAATQKIAAGKSSSFSTAPVIMHTQTLSTLVNSPSHVRAKIDKCQDKGPPAIKNLSGTLISGRQVGIYGRCFGDQTGSVELIGPFPDGKMKLPFNHWDHSGVILEVPANIRGVQDQTVSISVITAEGNVSAAMPVKFVAARELVEVPQRMWSPTAGFAFSEMADEASYWNKAFQGRAAKTVRINPQCALSEMAVDAQAGGIVGIYGFVQGITNEANVSIDWVGACTQREWRTASSLLGQTWDVHYSYTSACNVTFNARAWAYCPVGISP